MQQFKVPDAQNMPVDENARQQLRNTAKMPFILATANTSRSQNLC